MKSDINPIELAVFLFFFLLVTVIGLFAGKWRRTETSAHLDEWGLGGRQFGTWITWFLVGGDFYTAYTIIAVPALVFGVGAYGFFALPYTIIVYPFVFAVMPTLWRAAVERKAVTVADVVRAELGSRALESAIAATGVVATMPYIALQMIGMVAAIKALGIAGEVPLIAAFTILALYDLFAGLRAPALIAVAKDAMIYIAVIAAIVLIPIKLGGYGTIFDAAEKALAEKGGGILLGSNQYLAYATVALGSALAAFMYPHTLTGVFASSSARTIRKNAMLLPLYTLMLGLLALLGYAGLAAHLKLESNTDVVPALFQVLFPAWFAGFAFAAIAIGALVPAAVMSIGSANLFTRNFWKAYVNPAIDAASETRVAKFASLMIKLGAVLFVLYLPTQFAINLQLLGGLWILQTLPAVLASLFFRWLSAPALFAGWAVGTAGGTYLAWSDGLKPLHTWTIDGTSYTAYVGIVALVANIFVAIVTSLMTNPLHQGRGKYGARI